MEDAHLAFVRLMNIMNELREKCPWDRKQTLRSLRNLTIEETYELADAILEDDLDGVAEEVGDLMLHMVFYAKILRERKGISMAQIINEECEKLIERHPHIYGDVKVKDEEDVKKNWEEIKQASGTRSVLSGVPDSLPAMVKAYRMQEKTKQVGFEWENAEGAWGKVLEELRELKDALDRDTGDGDREEEFGDVLFSLINFARYHDIDPETALATVNNKFKTRFEYIEEHAAVSLRDLSLEQMDELWERAKNRGNKGKGRD